MLRVRADAPAGPTARLGMFLVVLAVATAAGWGAGQQAGPIRVPEDASIHSHVVDQ